MYEQVEKPKEQKSRAVANSVAQKKSDGKQDFGFVDNRSKSKRIEPIQKVLNNETWKEHNKQVITNTKIAGVGAVALGTASAGTAVGLEAGGLVVAAVATGGVGAGVALLVGSIAAIVGITAARYNENIESSERQVETNHKNAMGAAETTLIKASEMFAPTLEAIQNNYLSKKIRAKEAIALICDTLEAYQKELVEGVTSLDNLINYLDTTGAMLAKKDQLRNEAETKKVRFNTFMSKMGLMANNISKVINEEHNKRKSNK